MRRVNLEQLTQINVTADLFEFKILNATIPGVGRLCVIAYGFLSWHVLACHDFQVSLRH